MICPAAEAIVRLGLAGRPVRNSLSPAIFRELSKMLRRRISYAAVKTGPEELKRFLREARRKNWSGFNVTHPLKEKISGKLDGLEEDAAVIRAVNTVKNAGGKWKGFNTDPEGLADVLGERRISLKKKTVRVWGAGGAARAACLVCARLGAAGIIITNRTRSRACSLGRLLKRKFPDMSFSILPPAETSSSKPVLWINATSLGMPGNPPAGFWKIPPGASGWACDFVYGKGLTPFLETAGKRKLRAIDGKEVLVRQALAAWEIWTGEKLNGKKHIAKKIYGRLGIQAGGSRHINRPAHHFWP
ncbi:MAG: hypothetical protein ABIG11_07735 [bacterium]